MALFSSCTCSGAGPRAGGATPYVRCATREPAVIDARVGSLHLFTIDHTLQIDGITSPLHVAAFRGAALAEEPLEPALDAIESGRPAMQLVIGSLGDDEAHVEALLRALATLQTPSIIVMGGRDHPADLTAALAALPAEARTKIVDASGIHRIRIPGADLPDEIELVPVPGAPDGRYARDDESCGLGASDVDAIARELGEGGHRFVIGYAAPTPLVGIEGAEAGSALVADLVTRTGAHGGLYAWPDAVGTETSIIVPPLAGPPALLADGSRLGPGVVMVELSAAGMRRIAN